MPGAPNLYDVQLTVNAEGPEIADALRAAFDECGPFLASPLTLAVDEGYMRIRFATVSDDPVEGLTDDGRRAPGAEVVGAMVGFSSQNSLTVALIKALLTFTAVREAAGLPPRDELRIDVVPAPRLHQDSLSPRLSDAVPDDVPRFGGEPPSR